LKTIKFNPEFIPLVLSGEKTQTRRPMKPQPVLGDDFYYMWNDDYVKGFHWPDDWLRYRFCEFDKSHNKIPAGNIWEDLQIEGTDLSICLIDCWIERLDLITAHGCISEGFKPQLPIDSPVNERAYLRSAFFDKWDEIYKDTEFVSSNDPWVWVYSFSLNKREAG
jgi:hypothetical protein